MSISCLLSRYFCPVLLEHVEMSTQFQALDVFFEPNTILGYFLEADSVARTFLKPCLRGENVFLYNPSGMEN